MVGCVEHLCKSTGVVEKTLCSTSPCISRMQEGSSLLLGAKSRCFRVFAVHTVDEITEHDRDLVVIFHLELRRLILE